jgi:hypothetical protein
MSGRKRANLRFRAANRLSPDAARQSIKVKPRLNAIDMTRITASLCCGRLTQAQCPLDCIIFPERALASLTDPDQSVAALR